MELIYQDPNDLEYGVFDRLPLPDVTELVATEISVSGHRVTFTIIGESHKVEIWSGDSLFFAEILACMPIEAARCVHHHRFSDGGRHEWAQTGYQFVADTLRNHIPEPTLPNMLVFEFPLTRGIKPITRIEWHELPIGLMWVTIHVYPDHSGLTTVSTFSLYRFPS